MRLVPRDYQQHAIDAALAHMRSTDEPGVLELCTGAGKSVVIAFVAHVVTKAKKKVLVLGPNAEIVTQNAEKYRSIGENCSIFSASLGKRHTGHDVIFGTPLTVVNQIECFGPEIALLVIDECHGVSENDETTYQKIISHLISHNPKLRILGLTATPMRMKEKLVGKKNTFKHNIFSLPHHQLAALGFVVPYELGRTKTHYDLINLNVQSNGKFKQSEVDNATLNRGDLTRAILDDMIETMAADNRRCAMIFAASIKHANEILSYLPSDQAVLITGKSGKTERTDILEETKAGKWKYLINVAALTTGVDLPIVDTIVLVRATESRALFLQILGRGCRLYDPSWSLPGSELNWKHDAYKGKRNCLVLDHGETIERFGLDDDLTIAGLVDAKQRQEEGEYFEVACPECNTLNKHTSQRCVGTTPEGVRCSYRFIYKFCDKCEAHNSPSARHCWRCDAELINPEEKLSRSASLPVNVPFQVAVIDMTLKPHWKGDSQTLRIDYKVTDGGKTWTISEFKKPGSYPFHKWTQQVRASGNTVENVIMEAETLDVPTRLMVKRRKGSKYYEVVALYFDAELIAA